MHDLAREPAENGTQSARWGGTPLFFCKECDSKGVSGSIMQECDCKGVPAGTLQEYDSEAIMFGSQTIELGRSCKDSASSENGRSERDAAESWKLGPGIVVPGAPGAALRIASMFYFTAPVKRHLQERRPAEEEIRLSRCSLGTSILAGCSFYGASK